MKIIDQILRMQELQALMKELDDAKAPLQEEYDKLRLFDIPNAMSEQDTTSIKGEWGRCTLQADLSVQVSDKPGLHEWLKGNGFGDLIVPTVNSQTLKAFVKEQLGKGTPLPETIITINPFSRAVLYKK